jgi:hypothetical protein
MRSAASDRMTSSVRMPQVRKAWQVSARFGESLA